MCGIKGFYVGTEKRDTNYQLYHAMRFGGLPPVEWNSVWNLQAYLKKNLDVDVFDRDEAWKRHKLRHGPDGKPFYDMVMKMVVTDLSKRIQLAIPVLLFYPAVRCNARSLNRRELVSSFHLSQENEERQNTRNVMLNAIQVLIRSLPSLNLI